MMFMQAVSSVLRTPIANIDHLNVLLADSDASKVQWTLDCFNGMKSFASSVSFISRLTHFYWINNFY